MAVNSFVDYLTGQASVEHDSKTRHWADLCRELLQALAPAKVPAGHG